MTDTRSATHVRHVPAMKDVANKAIPFAFLKSLLLTPGYDASRILPAMLHYCQRIVQKLINRLTTDDSDHATHRLSLQFHRQLNGQFVRYFIRYY